MLNQTMLRGRAKKKKLYIGKYVFHISENAESFYRKTSPNNLFGNLAHFLVISVQ